MRKSVFTKNAPAPIGPYSQGIVTDSPLLFTAGQIAIDPSSGNIVEGDIQAQTRQALRNLQNILEAAGSSLRNVVKTTVFMNDMNEFAAMNEVYSEFFHESSPARSTVEVSRLPRGVKVEIDAIAAIEK